MHNKTLCMLAMASLMLTAPATLQAQQAAANATATTADKLFDAARTRERRDVQRKVGSQ